jgi:hypothetical protein
MEQVQPGAVWPPGKIVLQRAGDSLLDEAAAAGISGEYLRALPPRGGSGRDLVNMNAHLVTEEGRYDNIEDPRESAFRGLSWRRGAAELSGARASLPGS